MPQADLSTMCSSKLNAGVLRTLQSEGFHLDPRDEFETQYIDKHGLTLTELQLMNETGESVAGLIRQLHNQGSMPSATFDEAP